MVDHAVCLIRSRLGVHQGCVLGTFGAVLPYHLSLHRTNKACQDLRVVCDADDTIIGAPSDQLYESFEVLRTNEKEDCDLEENNDKLAVWIPAGGTEGIPADILANQGGEVHGLKIVGVYIGADTPEGIKWRSEELTAAMERRLALLDYTDKISDAVAPDARQLRYNMLRHSASRMPNYWLQSMPPHITEPVMRGTVDPRLRTTYELLSDAAASGSTPAQIDIAWARAQLATDIGGSGIGGNAAICDSAYCGTVLACLPRLVENCSVLYDLDLTTADLPFLEAFRSSYEKLCATRLAVATRYEDEFDDITYWTTRLEKFEGHFHPDRLPRKLPTLAQALDPTSDLRMPPQRMLTMVMQHRAWLDCLDAAVQVDKDTPHPEVKHREASHFISISQSTSAGVLDTAPDGTFSTKVTNRTFTACLQRRGSLNLSCAKKAFDQAEASGTAVAVGKATTTDRLGDGLANNADHNRRHNSVLNATYNMVVSVAIGQVAKGDKEAKDRMANLNEGTITDVVELEGDEETGADCHWEVKVPSPTTKSPHGGRGSKENGGSPQDVGHHYAFGNTEERYRAIILGVKRKGRQRDGALNHKTGRGWVKAKAGKYAHALAQGARVTPVIVETSGAISPRSLKAVGHLAKRARGKHARDGTVYGRSRTSARSFYTHHTQRLSLAAACGDVNGIFESLRGQKQRTAAMRGLGAEAAA